MLLLTTLLRNIVPAIFWSLRGIVRHTRDHAPPSHIHLHLPQSRSACYSSNISPLQYKFASKHTTEANLSGPSAISNHASIIEQTQCPRRTIPNAAPRAKPSTSCTKSRRSWSVSRFDLNLVRSIYFSLTNEVGDRLTLLICADRTPTSTGNPSPTASR